ncbi:MAG: c-type cytochrome [Acidobacteria bacterium]|nr:c-type cytochrome [Acidobacteriota bacterium]
MRTSALGALLVLALGVLPAQERSRRNPYTSPDDVAAGARLYRPLCSNCHGQQGQGWPGFTPNFAGELHYATSDAALFDLLQTGIAGTDMPAFTFSERQSWQVVAYVRTFANRLDPAAGDPAQGSATFREQGCIRCHRIGDEGGRQGPDLRAAAAIRSAAELRRSILDPNESVHPHYFRVRATTNDGRRLEGLRLNEDAFSLQLLAPDGRLLALDKAALRNLETVTDSPMPSYRDRLSQADLDNLIAYLASLAHGEPSQGED